MLTRHVLMPFSIWALAISATPLRGTIDQTIEVSTAPNPASLDLIVPSNVSIQHLNALNVSDFNIQCNGTKYGFNPPLSDCEGARSYIPPDTVPRTFGERHTGLPDDVFPLPDIMMGDKAECYFQLIVIGDGATGRASLNQIRAAASALLLKCGPNVPSQGGIASNIGGDNNMAVVMGVFEPKVQCRGNFQGVRSCKDVLEDMPASAEMEVFGPHGTPFVNEVLPQEIVSEDDNCVLKLYSTGRSDVVAWYQIWQAVEATFAMCGRSSQGGSYRGLGVQGNVFLTLGNRRPTVTTGNSSNDATA